MTNHVNNYAYSGKLLWINIIFNKTYIAIEIYTIILYT